MLSASRLRDVTIFGLGIMPYISASIIFQLLAASIRRSNNCRRRAKPGRKKINEYTRYATFFLVLDPKLVLRDSRTFEAQGSGRTRISEHARVALVWYWKIATVLTMTAGTIFLMWLGEQIDEFGIGNGISLLIMAGILARMPDAGYQLLQQASLELSGAGGKLGIARPDRAGRNVRGRGDGRGISSRSASDASPCKAPSTFAAAASLAAPGTTCRSRSIRRA